MTRNENEKVQRAAEAQKNLVELLSVPNDSEEFDKTGK
jgi:hypothetical protein